MSRIYLPTNSQHRHLPIGTPFGYLIVISKPFHTINEPKRVIYEFECVCGTKYAKPIDEVKHNFRFHPHCGCKTKEHHKLSSVVKTPKCKECGTTNPAEFTYSRKNTCHKCRNDKKKQESKILQLDPIKRKHHNYIIMQAKQRSPESFMNGALRNLYVKCRKYPKNVKYECDLDIEYLLSLFKQQNGKCKITNIPMAHCHGCLQSISIDRIDNQRGHLKGNVQLVCKFANLGRRDHTIAEFKIALLECFVKQEAIQQTDSEVRLRLRRLLENIRARCGGKIMKARKALRYNLTLDFLCQLFASQNGLCAITGAPMKMQQHILNSCSIDRIDSSIGYMRDNVHLVNTWVNTAKGAHTTKEFKDVLEDVRTLI